MSKYVAWLLEADIKDREAAEAVMNALTDNADANEPGTTNYEWGVNSEGKLVSYERFADSAAALAHLGGFGANAEKFMAAVTPTKFQVFGHPSDELKGAIADWQPDYVDAIRELTR
jgi:quinol monooxygenase YgiN